MNRTLEDLEAELEGDRCKHPPCTCTVRPGTRYCSAPCEAMGETAEIECMCGHPGCKHSLD